ncbi:transposase [Phocaeicola sp.]
MSYNSDIHHRHSVRLKDYDYSLEGLYFITVCAQDKKCLFGKITDGVMCLNEAGRMVEKWYLKISQKFPDIECLEFIIMPNHFHCILRNVGADPCVRPNTSNNTPCGVLGEHMGSPLQRIVQWFKTMTTNEYIRNVNTNHWPRFNNRLWQRNYYEHIIRNQHSYEEISDYIVTNPLRWEKDQLFVEQ